MIRGYGAFTKEEVETFPDPSLVKMRAWLKHIMECQDDE
jgi:hypothetical protein